jgi:hypothetical protein
MKLYHYTATSLGESILSSDISKGHLMHSDGRMSQGVVWLTTDPRPGGHGLTLGNERLTQSQVRHLQRVQGGPLRNHLTLDKTQLRITVELDPAQRRNLVAFTDYAKEYESKEYAKWYGVSCLVDMKSTPDKEIKRLMRVAQTKERTWWLSFGPVSPAEYVGVEFNVKGRFEPYDFERHGREAMREVGFVFPCAETLAEVADIVKPAHALERAKAFVICEDATKPAKVAVRGGGTIRAFELASGELVAGADDAQMRELRDWSRRHRDELEACWSEAVEIYYCTYPDRRPATVH